MGSYKEPKKLIQEYLDEKAKSDELFDKMYKKPGKDIDSCWAYIVNMAKRKGGACVCMSDDEVFGLAVHYYCEDKLDVKELPEGFKASASKGKVEILSDDEKKKLKKQAEEEFKAKMKKELEVEKTQIKKPKRKKEEVGMASLFEF